MNKLVKIISYDPKDLGSDNPEDWDDEGWHLSVRNFGDEAIYCSGQYYQQGCSDMKVKLKQVKRGGITCKECMKKIKEIKAVKL